MDDITDLFNKEDKEREQDKRVENTISELKESIAELEKKAIEKDFDDFLLVYMFKEMCQKSDDPKAFFEKVTGEWKTKFTNKALFEREQIKEILGEDDLAEFIPDSGGADLMKSLNESFDATMGLVDGFLDIVEDTIFR